MALCNKNGEKKRLTHDFRRHEEEVVRSLCRLGSRPISPRSMQEEEKRIRREIANSNERRRMQSINAGFQYLRKLLPQREGEKLSKASILQQTADFIYQLEQEKTCLLALNSQLKRRVIDSQITLDSDGSNSDLPFSKKRKRSLGDSVDDKLNAVAKIELSAEDMKREIIDLRLSLESERFIRVRLEEQIKNLESRLGISEVIYDIALQDHASYHSAPESVGKPKVLNILEDNQTKESSPEASVVKESFHEVPFSPELPPDDGPEDLSGKNHSIHLSYKIEVPPSSDIVPILNHLTPGSSPSYSMEHDANSHPDAFKILRSRPNLETIVEAIRHVEGDHMFRDDSSPPASPTHLSAQWNEPDNTPHEFYEQSYTALLNEDLSLQHHIIRNAPVSQSRPGVIVSKLS